MAIPYVIEAGKNGNDKVYDLYSRLLKDRIIFVSGEFEENMANTIVAQLLFLNAQSDADIYMYINSPGGDVNALYAIYDTMCFVKPDIHTIGFGMVASAASFILAAGTKGKRAVLTNTDVMIHEFSAGAKGKANDLFLTFQRYERLYNKMAEHYSGFTGKDVETVKHDMQRDFFMTAEEAVAYGLADKVITKTGG